MKQLTCEMCGSTDLIKQDGVFVCQSCGIKYSVEEAKKMMIEGTVEVKGSVKIDNSDNVETYKEMAINAYNAGNTAEAYRYFLKVLEIDPTDYQSIFYKGMCQGWETSLARPRVGEAVSAYQQSAQYIPSEISQKVKELFISDLTRLMSAWFEKAQQRYFDVSDFYPSNKDIIYDYRGVGEKVVKYIDSYMDVVVNSSSANLIESVGELYCSACEAVCTYAIIYTDYSQEQMIYSGLSSKDKQPYIRDYDNMIFEVRKYKPSFRKPDSKYGVIERIDPPKSSGTHNLQLTDINYQKCLEADRAINQRLQRYKDEIVQRQKKERRDKYWSEHIVEKQKYEARLTSIDAELKTLTSQDAPFIARIEEIKKDLSQRLPTENQLADLKKHQNDLVAEKSKLGLFAGKQKKALQIQIDSLQSQIDSTDTAVKRQKKAIQDDVAARVATVEAERQPLMDIINALKNEKHHIEIELTRDR